MDQLLDDNINLLLTPGANHRLHSVVTTHAKNTCEDRGDAFYVMDSAAYGDSISSMIFIFSTASG